MRQGERMVSMTLSNAEKQQIKRIHEKINQVKVRDPECKEFKEQYEWHDPASEEELNAFEKEYDVVLPRDYRIFLGFVANGAKFVYNIHSLIEVQEAAELGEDQHLFDRGNYYLNSFDENSGVFNENNEDIEDLSNGMFWIGNGEEYFGYDVFLFMKGKYCGRRFTMAEDWCYHFIHNNETFLDMYERWLDDFIIYLDMERFLESGATSKSELRECFSNESRKLPTLNQETAELWEEIFEGVSPSVDCLADGKSFLPWFCSGWREGSSYSIEKLDDFENNVSPIERQEKITAGFMTLMSETE